MAAVAHVHKGMRGVFTCDPFDLIQRILQRIAIIRVVVNSHGADEPPAAAGGRQTDLAAKLITLVRLTLADALNMRLVNAVDFLSVMTLLMQDARSDLQQGVQFIVRMRQCPFDISNDASQIGLEFASTPLGSLHLLRMGVTALLAQ